MTLKNNSKIDVIVIDSHPLFREGLKRVLEMDPDLRIIAEGDKAEQLLSLYEQHQPDTVLMDINLKHKNEMEALQSLLDHYPLAKVLLFTFADDFHSVSEAIIAGVSGYLLKDMDSPMIINAIKMVASGGYYLHPKITTDFLTEFRKLAGSEPEGNFLQKEVKRPYHLLTARESEVLQLLAEGHSNKSIGETLYISDKTVNNHVSTILRKIGIHDRTKAVVIALKNGWVELR